MKRSMRQDKSVVLMSGGMDSCVMTAIASSESMPVAMHVSYGQLTQGRELRAFRAITDFYGIGDRLVVDQSYLGKIGGSALTDSNISLRDADLEAQDIPTSYVPFRNAHFISAAVSWAEVIGAKRIYIGAVEPDSSGYPDCRPEYYRIFNQLIKMGTRPGSDIEIITPLIHLRKQEIIKKGIELGAPFHLSWSCYRDSEEACGTCDSCALRLRAFSEAGMKDPIPYRAPSRGASLRP